MTVRENLAKTLAYPSRSVWGRNSVLKREFKRHSVEEDVTRFCGWPLLQRIVETSGQIGVKRERNRGFVSTCFLTGGRVSEVLALKPRMFSIVKGCHPKLVQVSGMPLLKRYKKVSQYVDGEGKRRYVTERKQAVRNDFAFRVDEPLVKPCLVWLVHALKNGYEWLFPSPYTLKAPHPEVGLHAHAPHRSQARNPPLRPLVPGAKGVAAGQRIRFRRQGNP